MPNTGFMRYSLPMSFLKNLKRENKPWAVLVMSRREYEVKRPWKGTGMSRDKFAEELLKVPAEVINDIKLDAEVEVLVKKIFGKDSFRE